MHMRVSGSDVSDRGVQPGAQSWGRRRPPEVETTEAVLAACESRVVGGGKDAAVSVGLNELQHRHGV